MSSGYTPCACRNCFDVRTVTPVKEDQMNPYDRDDSLAVTTPAPASLDMETSPAVGIQSDARARVVSVENLRAICDRVSGTSRRYEVTKVGRSRVRVTYSNPDEYGHSRPMTAVFPCWPDAWGSAYVALSLLRVVGDADGEGWQEFEPLRNCPRLWRDGDGEWNSHAELLADGAHVGEWDDAGVCRSCGPDCDVPARAAESRAGWRGPDEED